jgi:hypothetical protein
VTHQEYTTFKPHDTATNTTDVANSDTPYPRCGSPGPHRSGPVAGPHYQRLLCGQCGAFLRWLPKPRPAAQEVGVSSIPEAERRRQLTTWRDVAHRWTPQPLLPREGRS